MKVPKRYVDQIVRVWTDLMQEATDAMCYVDCDNDCDGSYYKTLDRLQDRFDKAIAHLKE